MPSARDPIVRRIQHMARLAGDNPHEVAELAAYGDHPKYRVSDRLVEFECGCAAERHRTLVGAANYDPVIFRGLPEQAVYVTACSLHEPALNDYVHFGSFRDFAQWRRERYARLVNRAA